MNVFLQKVIAGTTLVAGLGVIAAGGAIMWEGHQISTVASSDVGSCGASVSPNSAQVNSTVPLVFTVNNTDSVDIRWVKFTAGSENFEIISGSSSGWSTVLESPTEVIFRNGTISPGGATNFTVNVQTGVHPNSPATWPVHASDTTAGGAPAACSGDTAVAIIGDDTTPPTISNISVSNITTSAARITWTTDEQVATVMDWGTSTSYGTSATDATLKNNHTVDLSGLSANTTYHYRITATDASGNQRVSSDNTFTTAQESSGGGGGGGSTPTPTPASSAASSSSSSSSSSGSTKAASPTPTPKSINKVVRKPSPTPTPTFEPTLTVAADTTRPVVAITTDLSQPVASAPQIAGEASDDGGVSRVEYSTDGGRNWLPAALDNEPNRRGVTFTFTPAIAADDNYDIRVRAIDFAGNIDVSGSYVLVIDQLPPRTGATLLSVGPQILDPSSDGIFYTAQAIDTRLTISAVGGATTIDIIAPIPAADGTSEGIPHVFSLVKNVDSGLWSGIMHFTKPGAYQLTAKAQDGAGNITQRPINTLVVTPGGQITGAQGPVNQAMVELFYFEPVLQQFVSWQAGSFGQHNPQQTLRDGRYHAVVPPGRYYARVGAPGYATATTTIMSLEHSQPLVADIALVPRTFWQLGSLRIPKPQLRPVVVAPKLLAPLTTIDANVQELLAKPAPFTIIETDGVPTITTEAAGPSVVTFLSAWSPRTAEQLAIIDRLYDGQGLQASVVVGDATAASVASLRQRGRYRVPLLADPTGELFERWRVSHAPTHGFISAAGTVSSILSGVLNEAQLVHNFNH